jgi:hypothetical protein
MKMENVKDTLKKFLDDFHEGIIDNNKALFKVIVDSAAYNPKKIETIDDFNILLISPYDDFLDGFIREMFADDDDYVFVLKNNKFIERHFRRVIEKVEGFCCCADKSRTILNALLRYYKHKEEINFDYNQKYTFHLPKKIFTPHSDIIAFYKAVKSLFYGNHKEYINFYERHII